MSLQFCVLVPLTPCTLLKLLLNREDIFSNNWLCMCVVCSSCVCVFMCASLCVCVCVYKTHQMCAHLSGAHECVVCTTIIIIMAGGA